MKEQRKRIKGHYTKINGKKKWVKPYLRLCHNQNTECVKQKKTKK